MQYLYKVPDHKYYLMTRSLETTLECLTTLIRWTGELPTYQALADALGIRKETVQQRIERLAILGKVERLDGGRAAPCS